MLDSVYAVWCKEIINGILNSTSTPKEKADRFLEHYDMHREIMFSNAPSAMAKGEKLLCRVPILQRINKWPAADKVKEMVIVTGFHFQELFLVEQQRAAHPKFKELIQNTATLGQKRAHLRDVAESIKLTLANALLSESAQNELKQNLKHYIDKVATDKIYISRQQEVELQSLMVYFPDAIPYIENLLLCRKEGAPSNFFRDACTLVLLHILEHHQPESPLSRSQLRKFVAVIMTDCFQARVSQKIIENIDLSIRQIPPNNHFHKNDVFR